MFPNSHEPGPFWNAGMRLVQSALPKNFNKKKIYSHIREYSHLPSPLCWLVGPVQSTWNFFFCGENGLCQKTALKTCGPFAVLQTDGAAPQVYKSQLFHAKSIFFLLPSTSKYTNFQAGWENGLEFRL